MEVQETRTDQVGGRAELAKSRGAVLVAFDVSRFVRNEDCKHKALPTVDDFERFVRFVGEVQRATMASPKIHEDRSRSTKRGFKVNNSKPGRPKPKMTRAGDKKRRRMQFKLPLIRLFKQGFGNREIGRQFNLPEKTVRDWRTRYRKYWDASFLRI